MRIGMAAVGLWMILGMTATAAESVKPEAVLIVHKDANEAGVEVYALRDAEITVNPAEVLQNINLTELAKYVPGTDVPRGSGPGGWDGANPQTMDLAALRRIKELDFLIPNVEIPLSTAAFLVKWNGQNILIDAGAGKANGGVMLESLALAGVRPEDVDAVLLTHLHFDHVGGLEFEGEAVFPKAKIYLAKAELDAWTTDEGIAKLPEMQRPWAELAKQALAPYQGRIIALEYKTVVAAATVSGEKTDHRVPHQRDFPLYSFTFGGHTPGHTTYDIAINTEMWTNLQFIGDMVHIAEVQMPRPQTSVVFDVRPGPVREQRERTFKWSAEGGDFKDFLVGPHLPFPGIGQVVQEGDGYIFKPLILTKDRARGGAD